MAYDVARLAANVVISSRRLRQYFRERYGICPRCWLNRLRLQDAIRLLQGGASTKETAITLGLKDTSYFCELFRVGLGCPPQEFAHLTCKEAPKSASVLSIAEKPYQLPRNHIVPPSADTSVGLDSSMTVRNQQTPTKPHIMGKLLITLALSGLLGTPLLNGQINTGPNTSITGTYSSIAGGNSNKIDAPFSIIAGGQNNTNSANYTATGGGRKNRNEAEFGTIPGGVSAKTRSFGQLAYASGSLTAPGDAQMGTYVLRGITTNSTQSEIFLDGSSERIFVPTNSSFLVEVDLVARGTNLVSEFYGNFYHGRFGVENQNGTLVTQILSGPTPSGDAYSVPPPYWGESHYHTVGVLDATSVWAHTGWDFDVSATGNSLRFLVTGGNETIRWVAVVRTVEVLMP